IVGLLGFRVLCGLLGLRNWSRLGRSARCRLGGRARLRRRARLARRRAPFGLRVGFWLGFALGLGLGHRLARRLGLRLCFGLVLGRSLGFGLGLGLRRLRLLGQLGRRRRVASRLLTCRPLGLLALGLRLP